MVIFLSLRRNFLDTCSAHWYFINLSPLESARLGRTAWCLRRSVFKQFLHADALNNPPVTAEQAAVAAPVPKAPTQAHALVAAEDNLAAHLADREVEESIVAWLAGQPGAMPHHSRYIG